MPKRPLKPKDIVARSISLTDAKGKTRIYMGVSDEPAHSSICLFGERERAIELSADQEGGMHISIRDGTGKLVVGLGISSDDRVGLFLYDHRSGTRTDLGSTAKGKPHHVTLHHQGKVQWTTQKHPKRNKRTATKKVL